MGDIERVRSYGDVAVQPKDLTRDLADVKDFIRRVVNDDHPSKSNPHEDLNELSALVPKELERVLNKRDRLEQELASLQSL
jgi:predicted component of type VI protein secretion system